jgi:hypothetical protein
VLRARRSRPPHRFRPPRPPRCAASEPTAAPYEELQVERERKRAQETLARLVTLQIKLDEQMHAAQWGKEAFDAALHLANQGDDLFTKQKYDEAMVQYEQGIAALSQLVDAGETDSTQRLPPPRLQSINATALLQRCVRRCCARLSG